MQCVLAFLLVLSVTAIDAGENPPIGIKRAYTYTWIYDDRGTGAYRDVSIWRPKDGGFGYYPLGDTAVASHKAPTSSSVMVKELTPGALSPPVSFTEVWNDRGSWGHYDVRIFRMNPPYGYVCLGHVAVLGYSTLPDKNQYRCVGQNYVTTGRYQEIWMDNGSGARMDVGIWGHRTSRIHLDAVDANTFTAFANHHFPTTVPVMLSSRYIKN